MAADSVQPVPWVLRVSARGASKLTGSIPAKRMSVAVGPSAWPPLIRTALAPASFSCHACMAISYSLRAGEPASSAAASARLGVISVASGISIERSASTASGSSSGSPLAAIITGSSTTGTPAKSSQAFGDGLDDRARGEHADLDGIDLEVRATARICASTKSGGTTWTASTRCVFCAVSAVITLAP